MSLPSEFTAKLIAVFEGLRLTAYQDSGGVWTIGFGHTKGVTAGMTCTEDQATAWLYLDALPLFTLVSSLPVTAQAGYVSFGYNCGIVPLQAVLAGHSNMLAYVHDRHGNALPGLVARRALEKALIDLTAPPITPA